MIQFEVSVSLLMLIEQSAFLMACICFVDDIFQWLLGITVLYVLTEVTS